MITQEQLDSVFNDSNLRYPEDCLHICKVAAIHGLTITPSQAEKIWEEYSNSYAAGWLLMNYDESSDSTIMYAINSYVEERLK